MKKLLATVALVLGLAGCQTFVAPSFEEAAWLDACRATQACEGIEAPTVVESDTVFALSPFLRGARGVFFPTDGEDTVFIRKTWKDNDLDLRYLVLVHEMVHYIDTQNGAFDPYTQGCKAEAHAFAVMNRVARKIGRPDLQRTDWFKAYAQCDGS